MKRIIRLTESDLMKLVKRVIRESEKIEFGSREYSMDDIENDENMIVMENKDSDLLGNQKMIFAIEQVHQKNLHSGQSLLVWVLNCIHLANISEEGKISNVGKPKKMYVKLSDDEISDTFMSRGMGSALESAEIYTDHPKINLIPSSDEDGDKLFQKCMENDKSGVFDEMGKDMGMDELGDLYESRKYRKRYNR